MKNCFHYQSFAYLVLCAIVTGWDLPFSVEHCRVGEDTVNYRKFNFQPTMVKAFVYAFLLNLFKLGLMLVAALAASILMTIGIVYAVHWFMPITEATFQGAWVAAVSVVTVLGMIYIWTKKPTPKE